METEMLNLPSTSDALSTEADVGESWITSLSVDAPFDMHELQR